MNDQERLVEAMSDLRDDEVLQLVKKMAEGGAGYDAIQTCLNTGVSNVGKRFESGEYFIADLIVSGMIYRDALGLLMPLAGSKRSVPIGRVVIGVVAGDIHDIGKDIVVSLLRAEHFEVIDLGIDVRPERFAYAVRTYRPDVLLMSGTMTFAREAMDRTMKLLEKEQLRGQVAIMIGGSCVNEYHKNEIGADSWAYDTRETIAFCRQVVERKYGKTS